MLKRFASLLFCCAVFAAGAHAEDETYKKYQPEDPRPQPQEGIDWSRFSMYDARQEGRPKVLMIGDSICNANHRSVKEILNGKYDISFWASSMDATDPDFIYALNLVLEQAPYDIITYNNGLHGHKPLAQRVKAIENSIKFILEKMPNSKLIIVGTTPIKDQAEQTDRTLPDLAKKFNLPFVDLNAIMAPLDRDKYWSDRYHFKKPAVDMQGKAIAQEIERAGEGLNSSNLNKKVFKPAPVVKENVVHSNIVGLNTKSKVGKRVFMTGSYAHGAAWALREKLGKQVNLSAWETTKCITDPDFARMFKYAMTLLPYDYVLYIQPGDPHKAGKAWEKSFIQMMNFLKKDYPDTEVILCAVESSSKELNQISKFLQNYAKRNKMQFFMMSGDDKKKPNEFISDTIVKALKISDGDGGVVQQSSAMGPSGAVK